jgi:hypothetical protein
MDTTMNKLIVILHDMPLPTSSLEPVRELLTKNVDSLYTLLYSKDTGVFANGYDNHNWVAICIILSSWIVGFGEQLYTIPKTTVTPEDIGNISINFIQTAIDNRLFPLSLEQVHQISTILLLSKSIIVGLIIHNLQKVNYEKLCGCCIPFKKDSGKVLLKAQVKDILIKQDIISNLKMN